MSRYRELDKTKTDLGRRYIKNPIYPDIPVTEDDIYIISSVGDRYDTLALQFYKDSSLWWIIAMANTNERASLVVTPGTQLRIPADKAQVLELYNEINKNR